MSFYSPDILYAWAQLGLAEGATLDHVRAVVENARAYRFATRERIKDVERFADFFVERSKLGEPQDSFESIRKAYHKKAMELHPDRNSNDPQAEEKLKAVNASFEIIEDIYKEARDYFKRDEEARRTIETEARETTEREARAAGKGPSARTVHMSYEEAAAETKPQPRTTPPPPPRPPGAIKYMAAWVPRYIRNARLFYLGRDAVIGSKLVKSEGSVGLLYDVIMLPERDFLRAKLNLGLEGSGSPALEMSRITPAYIPLDIKQLVVPPTETNPHEYAKTYFQEHYGLMSET